MGERLSEPNIYLFAFHLLEGFNTTPTANNLDSLKERYLEILKNFQVKSLPDLHATTNYSIPIEGEVYLEENPNNPDIEPLIVKGFVHPLNLSDSYAFGLNIGCPEPTPSDKYQDIDITDLGKFHLNCLLPNFVQSSLGQTLLITAKLTIAQKREGEQFIRELADKCVQNFIPSEYHNNLGLDRDGELFGSPIFEYGNPNQPDSYIHVIVWLFTHPETEAKFGDCYQDFLILLFYRHKIIQSYKNSRYVKMVIADDYQKIENQIDKINELSTQVNLSEEELKQLKTQLKELPKMALEYAQMLRDLEDYRHTIGLNDRNYLDTIDRIGEKIKLNSKRSLNKQLIFLIKFSQKNSRYFQEQIEGKLGYFVHGSGLLDKAIASIRGIVEIEQAEIDRQLQTTLQNNELAEKERDRQLQITLQKNEIQEKERDRNLQTTIAIVGVGIGFAGVAATASPYLIEQDTKQNLTFIPVHFQPSFGLNPPHNLTISVLFSLGAGLVGVAIAAIIMGYIQKHEKSAIARTINFILGNSQAQENLQTEPRKISSSQSTEFSVPQQPEKERSHSQQDR